MATKKKKTVEEGAAEKKKVIKKSPKGDNVSLFTLAVVAILILGVVGIVFGYTKDQLTQIQKGGSSKALENEIQNLKKQLSDLNKKAKTLEEENDQNKEIVVNLFDKNRELPEEVNIDGWSVYNNNEAMLTLRFPETWEVESANRVVKDVPEATEGEDSNVTDEEVNSDPEEYVIFLQPKGNSAFSRGVTIRDDYVSLWGLTLEEKYDIFSELNLLDEKDFDFGKLLYFIDIDKDNNEIPTVLVLTEDRILRNTFNISDKTLSNYIRYRLDYEAMMVNFEFIEEIDEEIVDELLNNL